MRRMIVNGQGKALAVNGQALVIQDGLLPSGFTRLAYVTLNAEYFNTGIKTNKTSIVEGRARPMATTSTYLWLSDSGSSLTTNTTAYFSSSGNWRFGNRYVSIANTNYTSDFHIFHQSQSGVTWDGVNKGTYASISTFTSTNNLRFGSSASTDVRWDWFKHTKDGELVTWVVACKRDADDVAGFYDLVTNEFTAAGEAPA